MPRIYDGSTKARVIQLRLQGRTNKQICERLGVKSATCRVIWWQYKNPEAYKKRQREYYLKNKDKLNKDHYEWAKRNRDLYVEYRWRHKCNQAGVDWRMAS